MVEPTPAVVEPAPAVVEAQPTPAAPEPPPTKDEVSATAAAPEPPAATAVKQQYTVSSDPRAGVYLRGRFVGRTPFTVELGPKDKAVTLSLRASGFRSRTVRVKPGKRRTRRVTLEPQMVD